ncbi:MAG TPA: hypothetical protein VH372_16080 [Actinospica sp.]|jgi:hypothetical protein|nr:hypothetical protein [Actinospica sp.]
MRCIAGGLPTLLCGILALPALTRTDHRAAAMTHASGQSMSDQVAV